MTILAATLPAWLRALDEEAFLLVNSGLHELGWKRLDGILAIFNQLGSAAVLIPVMALVLVTGRTGRVFYRRAAEVLLPQIALDQGVQALKSALGRERPLRALEAAFADGRAHAAFGEHAHYGSLPSGHTATAFALAVVLCAWAGAMAPGWRRTLGRVLPFVSAALTGLARVYAGQHFPLDVLAGALLGSVASLIVLGLTRLVWGPRTPAPALLGPRADAA